MKLSALLRTGSLSLLPALVPSLALAADDGSLGALASGDAAVRASLSTNGLLGSLSPIQGAIVTALVVFAFGCVVAVLVARRLDRDDRGARLDHATNVDPDALFEPRAVPALFSFHPAAVPPPISTPEVARVDSSKLLPPASTPRLPGASSRRILAANDSQDPPHENTLVGWPPAGEIPADRPSQDDTRVLERSGVVPSARSMGMLGVLDAEVVHEPSGGDPDATTQFVRGQTLSLVAEALSLVAEEVAPEVSTKRTILPPTIRPIPISPPRATVAIAPTNVSDLSFDDFPTEIALPPWDEVERELVKSSEIRAIGPKADADETQAFLLVKSS
jgi:hypothetical protein